MLQQRNDDNYNALIRLQLLCVELHTSRNTRSDQPSRMTFRIFAHSAFVYLQHGGVLLCLMQ